MARSRLVVGAHVVVYVNNRLFGRVAELDWSSMTPRKAHHTIDTLEAVELMPLSATVNGTIQVYRLHQDGGVEGAGMVAHFQNVAQEKYFSIMVVDRLTDDVLFQSDRCAVTSQHWKNGRGYVMGTISFDGLLWRNSVEPSQQ